jgi:hypothetical protein
VRIDLAGASQEHVVLVVAGETVVVEPTPPAPPPERRPLVLPPRPPARLEGIHPAWLTIGFVATAGLGGGSIASYVDALAIEEALEAKRSAHDTEGADALIESGRAAEVRTYVLEGLTAGSALATLGVALFAVDWNGAGEGRGIASVRPLAVEGAGQLAGLEVTFRID